jgi:D-beta-D-heptose 7-phosphate kinase/D-beta-D-heptose 1-phosphate adenosyltransferase
VAVSPAGALVDRFADLSVLVVGEAMLDVYLHGRSQRLCREAPVPIVAVEGRWDAPGGAANTAVNARHLGAAVTLLSLVGADDEGRRLRAALEARGVRTEHVVVDPGRRTLTKQRVLAGSHLLLRFDEGSTEAPPPRCQRELGSRLRRLFAEQQAVIVSDYGYGVCTGRVISDLAAAQARSPRVVVVDSKTLLAYRDVGPTAVKPNGDEALALLGAGRRPADSRLRLELIAREGGRLLDLTGAQVAAVTLDADGALVFERGRPPYRTYAEPTDHGRAVGAGDTFACALALALAAGGDVPAAAEVASAAAAVVVGRQGTATCSAAELRARLALGDKFCPDTATLLARLAAHREHGRRIVFTNGCFDILHRGHVASLNAAKALGDVLVVALNTDAGVRRLKGPGRPINPLEDRVQVLAALSSVDHIVAFDEETPVTLLRQVRPDVFVKGGDYTRGRLPEAAVVEALGGQIVILPYVEDRSTTGVIERIRSAALPGAA